MQPVRPLFYGIRQFHPWAEAAIYVAAVVVVGVFAWGVWRHVRRWRRGRPEALGNGWRERIGAFVKYGLFQGRLRSDRYALGMHLAIFFGMAVLFLGTILATIDQDVTHLFFGFQFLRGGVYLAYKLFLDLFAVALLAGLALAFVRRYALRPARLKNLVFPTFPLDSFYLLAILAVVAVTGLLVEALRLAASPVPWASWSPVGHLLAGWFSSVPVATLRQAHFALWLAHAALALTFVALIPFSKAFHLVASGLNIFLRQPGPLGTLSADGSMGAVGLTDFTWRQLLQFDACTWCGRCEEQCPAHASGARLSPKNLVMKLDGALLHTPKTAGAEPEALYDRVVSAPELWACTTCGACQDICPVFVEQPRAIVDLRRHLVSEGAVDRTLQDALNRLNRYGNSFGKSDRLRGRWAAGLQPAVKDARKEPVEAVWFLGDYVGYDPRLQDSALAAVAILRRAGVDFGLLYESERNAGNDARRAGEEGLFEVLRDKNLAALGRVRWKNGRRLIFTSDPHSYHALRNEYPLAAEGVEVRHLTELFDELIAAGRLPLTPGGDGTHATYHDPCFLGRYNGVYEPPRRVLEALGVRLTEMPRNRARSFCCGAGGGRIWMEDMPDITARPAEIRLQEAAALPGVSTFVVACPKDLAMFRDAVKTTGQEGRIDVRDIAELLHAAIKSQ